MKKSGSVNVAQRLIGWVGLCLLVLSLGCSSEDVGQQVECTDNKACAESQVCNVAQGVCEYMRADPERPSNPREPLPGVADAGSSPLAETGDEDAGVGVGDAEGRAGGDPGQVPDTGAMGEDVSPVEPDAGEVEDIEEDVVEPLEPTCEISNQSCDSALPDQGDFVCLPRRGGGGICRKACAQADQPSSCDADHYCRAHDVNGTVVLGCELGGCESNSDCDYIGPEGGNCVDKGGEFKQCVDNSELDDGEPCKGGAEDRCREGLRCFITHVPTNTGYCSARCNPWAANFECPDIDLCEPVNSTQGMCTDNVEMPGYVLPPYANCTNVGTMSDDASKCLAFSGGSKFCVPYCRAGKNDCAGVRQPGLIFDHQTRCDLTVFSNNNQVGYCL